MARNRFGTICDCCGKMSAYNEFYHLILPTPGEINNSTMRVDVCGKCYWIIKNKLKDIEEKIYNE